MERTGRQRSGSINSDRGPPFTNTLYRDILSLDVRVRGYPTRLRVDADSPLCRWCCTNARSTAFIRDW